MNKTRTLVIRGTVTVDGSDQPELEVIRRVPWPEDQTISEVVEAQIRAACRELHTQEKVWTVA